MDDRSCSRSVSAHFEFIATQRGQPRAWIGKQPSLFLPVCDISQSLAFSSYLFESE